MSFLAKADELIAGRYRLLRPIGEGGMGGVWEATDQVLGCPVALKMVPEKHLAGDREQQIQRFLREARISAQVQHPSVVRVTDFGIHEDTPYIAMELLEGESLAERMYRLPLLEIDEAVQICIGVLRGLGAAHEAGIVHRDIKPENVQLVSSLEGLYPKLIDFGISLGTDENNKRVSAVTTNGHVFGTPLYMSPEHARGHDIDGRADLYSLGIMLYEMVARHPPFAAETAADMMAAIVRDVPKTPRSIRPTVPEALSDAIMKALSKEPEDRFADANEMAMALAGAVPNARIDVTGPVRLGSGVHRISSEAATLPAPAPKRRMGVAMVLAVVALCVAGWLVVELRSGDTHNGATPVETASTAESPAEAEPSEAEVAEPEVAEPIEDTAIVPEPLEETTMAQAPANEVTPVAPRALRPRTPAARPTMRRSQMSAMSTMSFRQLDY